jgi:outer membrane protein OmpA-like peptidoglycan-associated protein
MCWRGSVIVLAGALLLSPATAFAAATCAGLFDEIQASKEVDLQTYKSFYDRAQHLADCDAAFRSRLGRSVAIRMVNSAVGEREQTLLEESLVYHRLWQALDRLGDIARQKRDFAQATRRYQQALDEINDPDLIGTPPDAATIEGIFRKAETAWLFSSTISKVYVETTRNRAGNPAGLASEGVRGFTPTSVAIPITFEYNSTCFTPEGAEAASDLAVQLRAKGLPAIELVGHTDPRGSDAYNLTLSRGRAQAVKGYLLEEAYCPGEVRYECATAAQSRYACARESLITTDGRGEGQPFVPDDPTRYSEDEIHQMSRRVELVR